MNTLKKIGNLKTTNELGIEDKRSGEYLLYSVGKNVFNKLKGDLPEDEWFFHDGKKFPDVELNRYSEKTYLIWFRHYEEYNNEKTCLNVFQELYEKDDEFTIEVQDEFRLGTKKRKLKCGVFVLSLGKNLKISSNGNVEGIFPKTLTEYIDGIIRKDLCEGLGQSNKITGLTILLLDEFEKKLRAKFETNEFYFGGKIFEIKTVLFEMGGFRRLFDQNFIKKYGNKYTEDVLEEYFFHSREFWDNTIIGGTKEIPSEQLKQTFIEAYNELIDKKLK